MADSVTTVLISAGVGGIAGSVFPAMKEAVSFVVLEASSQIEKLEAEQKANLEAFQSRQSFKDEVTTHTRGLQELIEKGSQMFESYRSGGALDGAEMGNLTVKLQREQAYLGPFDMKSRLSPEAATHMTSSIAFAGQMLEIFRQMRRNEYTEKGLLFQDQGDGPAHIALMGRLMELQAAVVSSLQLWALAEQEESARSVSRVAETDRMIRDLKRRRRLAGIFLGGTGAAAVIIVFVLIHIGAH